MVRLLLDEEFPVLETRIRVAEVDTDWQSPVRLWKGAVLNQRLEEVKALGHRSELAVPSRPIVSLGSDKAELINNLNGVVA